MSTRVKARFAEKTGVSVLEPPWRMPCERAGMLCQPHGPVASNASSPLFSALRRLSRVAVASVAALALVGASERAARADEATPGPSQAQGAQTEAPAAATAPPPSAAAALTLRSGRVVCTLGDTTGFEAPDVRTSLDIVCTELAQRGAQGSPYEVRFGRLGGKILVVMTEGTTHEERRAFAASLEEMPVVAPRLAEAMVHKATVQDSETVDNVLAQSTKPVVSKPIQPGVELGISGSTPAGTTFSAAGGMYLGLQFRRERWALAGQARAGGIGSTDGKLVSASVGVGGRYFLTDGDVAPFVGLGVGVGYFHVSRAPRGDYDTDLDGSGFTASAEAGAAFLRTGHVGAALSLRADAPFFALKSDEITAIRYDSKMKATTTVIPSESRYVVPLSLNVAITFQ